MQNPLICLKSLSNIILSRKVQKLEDLTTNVVEKYKGVMYEDFTYYTNYTS